MRHATALSVPFRAFFASMTDAGGISGLGSLEAARRSTMPGNWRYDYLTGHR
jgi:hypothetical protein